MRNMQSNTNRLGLCCLFCLLSFALSAQSLNCPQLFGARFLAAKHFYHQHKTQIQAACRQKNVAEKVLVSMIFPELMRYNPTRDAAETMANRLLYVNFGGEYGNFSIGCFQMKPSFIEHLEQKVRERGWTEFQFLAYYENTDSTEIRKKRVERLSNLYWQLQYALFFVQYVDAFWADQAPSQMTDICYLANLYNIGIQRSTKQIQAFSQAKNYPNPNQTFRPDYYNYGQISEAIHDNFERWMK